ncbi:MAG: CGGC domain-containing protein [Nanoarchaeota archaeon]|nr:CGGC domain-containing protein [Nanoarchaeota archaeon]
MTKIGVIICERYQKCGGGKCLRSLKEHSGGFAKYPKEDELELVGYSYCGGCPGGNIEYVPAEMIKNGAEAIHLATGLIVGYPPCPRINDFKKFIETRYRIPCVIGTHPIPQKYINVHKDLPFWDRIGMKNIVPYMFEEDKKIMEAYDQ